MSKFPRWVGLNLKLSMGHFFQEEIEYSGQLLMHGGLAAPKTF